MKAYVLDLLELGIIKQVPVTVSAAATSGLSAIDADLVGGSIVGVVPAGNQDQFINDIALATVAPVISGITLTGTDPVSVTATAHGLATGRRVVISGVVGTTELNGNTFAITVLDANTFTLDGTDSSNFTAYTSDGVATSGQAAVTVTLAAAATADNVLSVSVLRNAGSF